MADSQPSSPRPEAPSPVWRRVGVEALVLMGMWLLLSGHYDAFHLSLGVLSVGLVLVMNRTTHTWHADRNYGAQRFRPGRFLMYLPWLGREMLASAVLVAKVVLNPDRWLNPTLVRFHSDQPNDYARAILGNSITLTPGTLTVDVNGKEFLIHSLTDATDEGLLNGEMQARVARLFVDEPGEMVSRVHIHPPRAKDPS